MVYGYIRYSTDKQDEQQQMNNLLNYAKSKRKRIDEIVMDEAVSGGVSYMQRKLYSLVQGMNEGDTLITTEISRLGRSMSDLNKLINDELKPRKIRLIIIQMGIDLNCAKIKAIDEMLLFAFSFAAQLEKELIQSRTINALAARKNNGQEIGGTNNLWGKKVGNNDRMSVIKKAAAISAEKKKESAKNQLANKAFYEFICDYQLIHGEIKKGTNWTAIAEELNRRGKVTSSGLPFNGCRARAMYDKVIKLYN